MRRIIGRSGVDRHGYYFRAIDRILAIANIAKRRKCKAGHTVSRN